MRTLLHADLYRLDQLREIEDLGLGELLEEGGVALVEWGDAAGPLLGPDALTVRLGPGDGDDERTVALSGGGRRLGDAVGTPRRRPRPLAGAVVTLLAIETATDLVGAAVLRDDGGLAERSHRGGRAHAELLAPAVEEVCAVSGCSLADLDALAVDIGPGLFTGLRVGVATAKALGQALGLGLVGVTSLDILAAAALGLVDPGRARWVVSVVDARRGEVFAAAYAVGSSRAGGTNGGAGGGRDGTDPVDPAPAHIDWPEPVAPEALVELLDVLAAEGPAVVVGDGAVRYRTLLAPRPGLDLHLAGRLDAPPPAALARLASLRLVAGLEPTDPAGLLPDYRRHADARINWEVRAPQRGPVHSGGDRC